MADSNKLPSLFDEERPAVGESDDKTWRPLRFFNLFRFTFAALFVFLYEFNQGVPPPPLGEVAPKAFYIISLCYLGFSIIAMFLLHHRRPDFDWQRNIYVLGDTLFITLLMYSSGGVASGLGILLVISVAYGSMLASGRGPLLFAAVASLAVLAEETLAFLKLDHLTISYPPAGILGIALFATAIVAHAMAKRARESERLAEQRGLDLANMEQLTEYTIQQMRNGVLVVDNDYQVRLINGAAWRLLGSPAVPTHSQLADYCEELQQQLIRWQQHELSPGATLSPSRGPHELLPQYLPIGTEQSSGTHRDPRSGTSNCQIAMETEMPIPPMPSMK